MSNKKIMDSAWRSYSERVLPINAPDVQRQECRRAFYAGAQGLLGGIVEILDPGSEPTEADFAKMDGIQAELEQFCTDVTTGKA